MKEFFNYFLAIIKSLGWYMLFMILQVAYMLELVSMMSINNEDLRVKLMIDNSISLKDFVYANGSVIEYVEIGTLLIFVFAYIIDSNLNNKDKIILNRIEAKKVPMLISIGIYMNMIISLILTSLHDRFGLQLDINNVNVNGYSTMLGMIVCVGIFVPLCEEIVFRYLIFNACNKTNIIFQILVSSTLFALAHGVPYKMAYTFILGVMFCLVNIRFKSILPGVILHITINLMSVLIQAEQVNRITEVSLMMIFLFISLLPTSYIYADNNLDNVKIKDIIDRINKLK